MRQLGVSVIICCHNGGFRLAETVRHLAQQEVHPDIRWEFILVDNGCTDNSVSVAEAVWTAYEPPAQFRVVKQPILGLSHARAKGFEEAQYEFMIMCDDDNWLAPDYVAKVYEIMSANTSIGALGGFGTLKFEVTPPKWIERSGIFAAGAQANTSGRVIKKKLYGAGCVIKKSAYLKLKALGFRSLLVDRKGTSLSSGGDHELCYALAIAGFEIWYDERLRFVHFITKERLTWEYFLRYARESAVCFDVITCYKMIASNMSAHELSFMVIARDLFYCTRQFVKINLMRVITNRNSADGRMLYFRHIIFRNKIMAYIRKYSDITTHHRQIIRFKEHWVASQLQRAQYSEAGTTFSLEPFGQPPQYFQEQGRTLSATE